MKLKKTDIVDWLIETDFGKGLGKQALINMRLTDLQEKAMPPSMNIMTTLLNKLFKSWGGNRKGLLEILQESAFIDELNVKNYRIKMLNEDGNVVLESSLEYMMTSCLDFANEMSQLEYVCQQMGSKTVIRPSIMLNLKVKVLSNSWDT